VVLVARSSTFPPFLLSCFLFSFSFFLGLDDVYFFPKTNTSDKGLTKDSSIYVAAIDASRVRETYCSAGGTSEAGAMLTKLSFISQLWFAENIEL